MSLMNLGFRMVRPVLHAMDGEQAHGLTIKALKAMPCGAAPASPASLAIRCLGIDFPNPLGLAPGFDKNAEVPDAMLAQGFGFVEVGTVTPRPQAGNPRPRLFRLVDDEAVINRMGFNNEGAAAALARLDARKHRPGIIGVNIGANKDAVDRIADYVDGITRFGAIASYLTINISSPNTPGLRGLQSRDELQRLLAACNAARSTLSRSVPMLLKIAPDLIDEELADIMACCSGGAVDGVIISNTTLARPPLSSSHRGEQGGLSGKPLFEPSTRMLAKAWRMTDGKLPLVGVGGIHDADTAYAKIRAGASLIQLYSALVYGGPALVRDITKGLAQRLARDGFNHVAEAVGKDAARLS